MRMKVALLSAAIATMRVIAKSKSPNFWPSWVMWTAAILFMLLMLWLVLTVEMVPPR
jgi:hypothetical protein